MHAVIRSGEFVRTRRQFEEKKYVRESKLYYAIFLKNQKLSIQHFSKNVSFSETTARKPMKSSKSVHYRVPTDPSGSASMSPTSVNFDAMSIPTIFIFYL